MEEIKLIAIDLDDTLFNSQSMVSEENLYAIRALKDHGVYFVPCSGRSLGEMPSSIVNNPFIRYIIHSNGGAILDKATDKTTFSNISPNSAKKIFDTLKNFKTHVTIRANGNCYFEKGSDSIHNINFYNICDSHVNVLKNYAIKIDNYDEWKYSVENVSVVSVFFHDFDELQKCREILSKEEDILVVSCAKNNLEIISRNAGKGNGILTLANMLGVDLKNVLGVGDSGNDLPMMRVAGMRFAVSNATDELKSACDLTICSNDEHAVDYILKNFITNE